MNELKTNEYIKFMTALAPVMKKELDFLGSELLSILEGHGAMDVMNPDVRMLIV